MTDKQNSLMGAGISDAHLNWLHLTASNTRFNLNNLYWPDMKESDLRGNSIEMPEDIIEIMRHRLSSSDSAKSSTRVHRLAEQLYHEGDTLNLAAQRPLTGEEQAERERLAHLFASGKPLSEMIIEDRGSY